MARRAEGWKLVKRGRIYRVRFTYKTKRYEITTCESVAGKAELVAAQIYSDVVAGRVTVTDAGNLVHPTTTLADLCSDWIIAIEPELGRKTGTTYTVYAKHWCEFFETIGRVTTGNISNYGRKRLGSVTRATVSKELSAFRRFLLWAFDEGMLREVPEVRMPSKKALGVKHAQGRKAPTHLSPEQVEAILAALPVKGRARGGKELLIRDYFTFCYETALRPDGTLDHLEERDFTPAGLHIRPELDKNRWERTVPLSERAATILGRIAKGEPTRPFFGDRDRRDAWRKAAIKALGPELGKKANPYDLKHARVTAWFSAGKDPMGVRFLTGTNEAIDKYALPSRLAAERALWGDSGARPVGESAKGEDRTRTGVTPLAPQASVGEQKPEETRISAADSDAIKSTAERLSGAGPQLASARFRALSAAWFQRSA
jgi:integrase